MFKDICQSLHFQALLLGRKSSEHQFRLKCQVSNFLFESYPLKSFHTNPFCLFESCPGVPSEMSNIIHFRNPFLKFLKLIQIQNICIETNVGRFRTVVGRIENIYST